MFLRGYISQRLSEIMLVPQCIFEYLIFSFYSFYVDPEFFNSCEFDCFEDTF